MRDVLFWLDCNSRSGNDVLATDAFALLVITRLDRVIQRAMSMARKTHHFVRPAFLAGGTARRWIPVFTGMTP
jgi:hypothetical protein